MFHRKCQSSSYFVYFIIPIKYLVKIPLAEKLVFFLWKISGGNPNNGFVFKSNKLTLNAFFDGLLLQFRLNCLMS